MGIFPDTMSEMKAEYLKERTAHDKSLRREIALGDQLALLRKRIETMASEYEFAGDPGVYRAVVTQLRAILAEEH